MGQQQQKEESPPPPQQQQQPPPIPDHGIYPRRMWKTDVVWRAISCRKLAPIVAGVDASAASDDQLFEECPICFLWYAGGLNRTRCCRKPICTECFLQIRPHLGAAAPRVRCPFCNAADVAVTFAGPPPPAERARVEEQLRRAAAEKEAESAAISLSLTTPSAVPAESEQSQQQQQSQLPENPAALREAEAVLQALFASGEADRAIAAADALASTDALTDEQQLALAILRSLRDQATSATAAAHGRAQAT